MYPFRFLISYRHAICCINHYYFVFLSESTATCKLGECSSIYVSVKTSRNIEEGHNPKFCMLLDKYLECTKNLADKCRGDIKFHSEQRMINSLLSKHECSDFDQDDSLIPSFNMQSEEHSNIGNQHEADQCGFPGSVIPRAHCGLFGDPHLRTFKVSEITAVDLNAVC